MSKNLSLLTKTDQLVKQKSEAQFPVTRDVQPLVPKSQHDLILHDSHLVTAYKDLNAEKNQSLLNQTHHMIFAFVAFILLGLGIFMGNHYSKARTMASTPAFKGIIPEGAATHVEHYQYDKSCYTGETGEQVCMTRTSRK